MSGEKMGLNPNDCEPGVGGALKRAYEARVEKMGRGVPPGWPGILSAEKAYGPRAYGPIGAAQLERGALKTSGVAQESQSTHDPAAVARAQAAARRRVENEARGARAELVRVLAFDPSAYGAADPTTVEAQRTAMADYQAALDRLVGLHTPCDCAEANREAGRAVQGCSKCPAGES